MTDDKRLVSDWPIGPYCVKCMKFGQLMLRKIIQIVAILCHS